MGDLQRLAAFTTDPSGGNPAGVWIGEALPGPAEMQRIAAEVGYSETAFLEPARGAEEPPGHHTGRRWTVRYFSPAAEVDFCGHATIASAVALAEAHGAGRFTLHSNVGPVVVDTAVDGDGPVATLTSVRPEVRGLEGAPLRELLQLFGWAPAHLHPDFPPAVAFAGVWHPILVLADRARLAGMAYPWEELTALMAAQGWTTVQLAVPRAGGGFDCRNPFPVGGVVEDPATGAAAAAFGAYLRERGLVDPPADVRLVQGEDMGRRSTLHVHIPAGDGGIRVSGHAVALPEG